MPNVKELSALMFDTHSHVYNAAADLFDPNTTLDLENEYHRGVTETVMNIIGINSDYKEEIAELLSQLTVRVDHEQIARTWIRHHGTYVKAHMANEIRKSCATPLSDRDLSIITHLITISELEITFPTF